MCQVGNAVMAEVTFAGRRRLGGNLNVSGSHTTFGSVMLSPFASLRVNSAKHPGIFFALIELSNAGILLPQGGIRMTGCGLFVYE